MQWRGEARTGLASLRLIKGRHTMNTQGWDWLNQLRGRTLAICLVAAWATASSAATYYVAKTGDDTTGNGTSGAPWATITKALTAAGATDTIRVGGGVYSGTVTFTGETQVTVEGGYDASWNLAPATEKTVLAGTSGNSPVVIPAGASNNTLRYLTLRGGTGGNKAGIEFAGAATQTFVESCTITNNAYGIYSGNVRPQSITIKNTLIARNTQSGLYFALANIGSGTVGGYGRFYNCTIAYNGGDGVRTSLGGPDHGDLVPIAVNTIFANNGGIGLFKYGTISGGVVSNCLFHANAGGAIWSYVSLIQGGNKTRAPRFTNVAASDFSLQSSSGAAAAGTDLSAAGVTQDIVGVARPASGWDMGAFESSGSGEGALVGTAYVNGAAGSDTTGDGSSGSPWATIQYALGQTQPGGEVRVAGGNYTENLGFGPDKKQVTIRGGYNASDWSWSPSSQITAVSGAGNSVVAVSPNATSNRLEYLTLKNATGGSRAGIEFSGPSLYLFTDGCRIVSNTYGVTAGYMMPEFVTMRNTLVARNTSHGHYYPPMASGGQHYFYNCVVANNGGDGFQSTTGNPDWNDVVPVAKNTIFANNTGYGINKRGTSAGGSVERCLFYGNASGATCEPGNSKLTFLSGNKSGRDPLFMNPTLLDYRAAVTSPAVAAGMSLSGAPYLLTRDLAGVSRPQGAAWDIGVYENDGAGEGALIADSYVTTTGSDTTGDGSSGSPWRTINRAAGYTAPGGTVHVGNGVFTENVALGIGQERLTIRGGYDVTSWVWSPATRTTVIDGNGNSPVTLATGANSNTLACLTLRRGTSSGRAGIEMIGTAPYLFVEGCTITNNYHGLYSGNRMRQTVAMRNTIVARNASIGVNYYLRDTVAAALGTHYFYNCTVANNGGAGFVTSGNNDWGYIAPVAKNTLFTGNAGYGIEKHGQTAGGSIQNCLFYGNTGGDWLAANGTISNLGNNKTGRDPKYVSVATSNYRLQGNSPAAASGMNLTSVGVTTDILGVARPQGADWDMGAYEGDGDGEFGLRNDGYVRKTGSDVTGDGSQGAPWATISYAVGNTVASGIVYVAAGEYVENVPLAAAKIKATVRGGYNPATWAWDPANYQTVINGNGLAPITIAASANSNRLSHLTLKGGTGGGQAGILFLGSAPFTFIDSCRIVSNTMGVASGSAMVQTLYVQNTLVARNSSYAFNFEIGNVGDFGAAGYAYLDNCTIADNGGDGFRCTGNPDWRDIVPMCRNTIFSGNSGYGIYKSGYGAGATAVNCLFYDNRDGAVYERGWGKFASRTASKSGRDPRFANPALLDYSLQSDSPAAAAGTNLTAFGIATDIRNTARPQGALWDIGAFEGAGAGESALPAATYVATTGSDATGNGSVGAPWATIRYAVGYTATGGTIRVAGGTYTDGVDLAMGQTYQTIRGGYTAGSWLWDPANQQTVIRRAGASAVKVGGGANFNVLSHLTLTGATGGSGIEFLGNAPWLTVENCTITNNYYGLYSGDEGWQSVVMRNTLVARNTAEGVFFNLNWVDAGRGLVGTCWLYNCTVADNGASGFRSGWNAADRDYVAVVAKNTLFTGNGGYGIYKLHSPETGGASIENCLFYANASGTFQSAITDLGGTLTASAPQYAGVAPHAYQLTATSPALNTGLNLSALGVGTDIINTLRPQASLYDRGAYELYVPPSGTMILLR